MIATASIILDKRRMQIKTGTYPVKLQIVHKSKPRQFQTVFNLSSEDYLKLNSSRLRPKLQLIKDKLKHIRRTTEEYLKNLTSFSFYTFERDLIVNNELFKKRKELVEPARVGHSGHF